jgi:hypothetical protein
MLVIPYISRKLWGLLLSGGSGARSSGQAPGLRDQLDQPVTHPSSVPTTALAGTKNTNVRLNTRARYVTHPDRGQLSGVRPASSAVDLLLIARLINYTT